MFVPVCCGKLASQTDLAARNNTRHQHIPMFYFFERLLDLFTTNAITPILKLNRGNLILP